MHGGADIIFSSLMETGEYTRSDDEKSKWDFLVCLKFRQSMHTYSWSKGGDIRAGKVASQALRTLTRSAS